jgi:16S rRNA U516 pseudouridylate synthase RsuA-like enzyme
MFEAVGYRVERLVRIRIGNLRIGNLPRGHWRALAERELRSLERRVPANPSPASRELRPPI